MRVQLDATMCDGYGRCAEFAPDVFVLDDWGYGSPVAAGEVPPGSEDAARLAAAECPVKAILIHEARDAARTRG